MPSSSNDKNSDQHAETMRQVPAGELASYLDLFRTLPFWLDRDGVRVVQSCVDWSVAKGGFLCADRWNGERKLDASGFVWTEMG